jgi:hypothetical protein
MSMTISQQAEGAFWSTFKGAGYMTVGGIAMMTEAASLFSLKLINSINTEEMVLRQLQNITCIALAAIAIGTALIVTLSSSVIASSLFAGAASLVFSLELAEKLSVLASLAFAAYTFFLHYNAFHWAFTPYTLG